MSICFPCVTRKSSTTWPKSYDLSSGETDIRRYIIHYRGLCLLSSHFNMAFGSIILPFLKLQLAVGFTICVFIAIRLNAYLNIFSLGLVSVFTWTSALLLIPISIVTSRFYAISTKFKPHHIPSIHRLSQPHSRNILVRMLKSCPLIRIHVGSLYYMEAKAKLTMIHKVVNGLKYLLVNVKISRVK